METPTALAWDLPAPGEQAPPLPPGARRRIGSSRFRFSREPARTADFPREELLLVRGGGEVLLFDRHSGWPRYGLAGAGDLETVLAHPAEDLVILDTWLDEEEAVLLWTPAAGEVRRLEGAGRGREVRAPVELLPDGEHLAVVDDEEIALVRLPSGEIARRFPVQVESLGPLGQGLDEGALWGTRVSPDGRLLAVVHSFTWSVWANSSWHNAFVWELETGRQIGFANLGAPACIPTHQGYISPFTDDGPELAFTPDGALLCRRTDNRVGARVWDVLAEREVDAEEAEVHFRVPEPETLPGNDEPVARLGELPELAGVDPGPEVTSPDGQLRATGDGAFRVRIEDLRRCTLLAELAGHSGPVRALAFSPDGASLYSESGDGTVLEWDLARLRPRAEEVRSSRSP